MKEAKAGKESIANKANYLSNRQTFICGGMKGILTFLIAFVLFGFSSCKKSPRENESPVPVKEANDSSTTSPSTSPVVPPSPVSPPPPSALALNSGRKSKSDVGGKVKGEGKEIGESGNISTSATNSLPQLQQYKQHKNYISSSELRQQFPLRNLLNSDFRSPSPCQSPQPLSPSIAKEFPLSGPDPFKSPSPPPQPLSQLRAPSSVFLLKNSLDPFSSVPKYKPRPLSPQSQYQYRCQYYQPQSPRPLSPPYSRPLSKLTHK